MTTGVGGCSKLAIAEFWSKFNADREPPDEEAEPLPADATGRPAAALTNGEGAVGVTTTVPIEVSPARGAAVDFVMGFVVVGIVPLAVSAAVCGTCPAATPGVTVARSAWDEVGGAVVEAIAGRLANVR